MTATTSSLLCGRIDGPQACAVACWRAVAFSEACPERIHHPACPAREDSSAACIGCPK